MPIDLSQLSTIQGSETGMSQQRAWVPLLTVLAHPQGSRVGHVAWLDDLQAPGRPVQLSRSTPDFGPLDGRNPTPLGSPLISRRPISLQRLMSGQWSVDPGALAGKVVVDGQPLTAAVQFDEARLDLGVVIRLGRYALVLLHRAPRRATSPLQGLVGESPAMQGLRDRVRQLARARGPVLIRGETGTGKELVAHALHVHSERPGDFVAVNLGAVVSSLAASELFGHVAGAFTGAKSTRDGVFVRAHRGTLLLDEVGDAPDDVQLALLRVLETRSVQPVGASRSVQVDVRVIAATDSDLEERITSGRFREPLYHRLATHLVVVPPLRERRADIPRLLLHFLRAELALIGCVDRLETGLLEKRVWLSAKLVDRLVRDEWSGNVRQLRNVARYLAGCAERGSVPLLDDPDLQRLLTAPADLVKPQLKVARRRPKNIDAEELEQVLERMDWQLGKAAAHFGISRAALNGLVDQHATLRRAKFLSDEEIARAKDESSESGLAMWQVLRVSRRGLARRLSATDRT